MSLCPVRVAGGVQFKILEALALGVPVVTSPEGFEGLGARGEEDGVIVARDAREFARASLELMRDRERRRELARRAQRFIAERYDWDRQVSALEALFRGPRPVQEGHPGGRLPWGCRHPSSGNLER